METKFRKFTLSEGIVLANRYKILEPVGEGGFGIVYKAFDSKLSMNVAIKEFFVKRLTSRNIDEKTLLIPTDSKLKNEFQYRKKRFLVEAKNLAKFSSHESIVNVFDYFEENNTAYLVMEYLEGISLSNYLKLNDNKLDLDSALEITKKVAAALNAMHKEEIYHLDIAPDNIFICEGDKVKVIDFGAAKFNDDKIAAKDVILKTGYSPIEQYENNGKVGPYSDIYALAATLYLMLTGVKPAEATKRLTIDVVLSPKTIDKSLPSNVAQAIMKGLEIYPEKRFKNVDDFIDTLTGKKKFKEEKPVKVKKIPLAIGIIVAIIVVGIIISLKFINGRKSVNNNEPTTVEKTEISLWIKGDDDSMRVKAFKQIVSNYNELADKNGRPLIVLSNFPEGTYETNLLTARSRNIIPDIFESDGISDSFIAASSSLEEFFNKEIIKSNPIFDDYKNKYFDYKELPLTFSVPVAYVVTAGPEYVVLEEETFESLDEFKVSSGERAAIAVDDYLDCIEANVTIEEAMATKEDFINSEAQVLLSSSEQLDEMKASRLDVVWKMVCFDSDKVAGRYETRFSTSTNDEYFAPVFEYLLSEEAQSILTISGCNNGELPVEENSLKRAAENIGENALFSVREKFIVR